MAGDATDVAVAGAGVAGLATALAIRSGNGPAPTVQVSDPGVLPGRTVPQSFRAVAITPASRRFLQALGVWDTVAPSAQPVTRMVLGDTRPGDVPAPELLRFDEEADEHPLAHMVLLDGLRAAILDACEAAGVVFSQQTVLAAPPGVRLLVAADGARSKIRENVGIGTIGWDYGQSAITATLSHSVDHGGEAVQIFLPSGPLALLPLRSPEGTGHWTSIVWTVRTAEAARLLALPAEAFLDALRQSGGYTRGDLALVDAPVAHPLAIRLARHLAKGRVALVGDAARVIHPLAGQGLNLGLQDAEALSQRVWEAASLGLDLGGQRVLAAYERERRADQVAMAATTDGLNRLFSNDHGPVRFVRDLGLSLVDRWPGLKRAIVRRASGLR